MAALVPTEGGGRTVSWADHPRGWSAIPPELPAPYVLRQMIPVSDGADTPEESTLGPKIETDERLVPRWTAKEARQICLLEFQEGLEKGDCLEPSGQNLGIPESGSRRIWSHGQHHARRFVPSKQTGRRMSGVNRQKAAPRSNKPGPKPEHGFSLDARLRKIKSRCKKRGVPFILARYLKPKKEPEHEHSS